MPDCVLAVLEAPEAAAAVLAAGGELARLLGARLQVLAIRHPPETAILPTEEILTGAERAALEVAERQRIAALGAAFDVWVAQAGASPAPGLPAPALIEAAGDAAGIIAERGRRADLVVVAQAGSRHGAAGRKVLHAALFETHRPVLMAPAGYRGTLGRRVAIAWKDDSRAVKAVLAAMPILDRAEQVVVFAGIRAGAPAPGLPPVLGEHGIEAGIRGLPLGPRGSFGAALLTAAGEFGADLLVMGAYAHSPFSELLLGGVTRQVLAAANIPVLLRH